MNHSRRRSLACFLAVAVVAAGVAGFAGPAVAAPAHPFYQKSFATVQGDNVPFNRYLGSVVVLNFWATWCPPCVKEMPDLDELQHKHPAVKFVGLAVDTAANVEKFGKKVQVNYDLLVAGHAGIQLMRDLDNQAGGLPYTVVFNRQGIPLKTYLGQINPADLDRYLADLP